MTGLIPLPANQPAARFYHGGSRIASFRGTVPGAGFEPEDWVGSVTTLAGDDATGLTTLADGTLLRDAIADDPVAWLGPEHVARYGADPMLLVKLLDAGQRLPVHAHPDAGFAGHHLGRAHGKAEAWYIVDGGTVHLGLRASIADDDLADLVRAQDVDTLLGLLHEIPVAAGDVVYVPPGMLHAIGSGIFLVELQEPEDLSILLEWRGFEIDGAQLGHLGLRFDIALKAVDRTALSPDDLSDLVGPAGDRASVLPAAADRYFRLERKVIDGAARLEPGFAVLVIESGVARTGDVVLPAGTTWLLPHAAGPVDLSGTATVLACRPPAA
jgi:mannose-6-phosphate isomerase